MERAKSMYEKIAALIARNDFATAEKLLKKNSAALSENQQQTLSRLLAAQKRDRETLGQRKKFQKPHLLQAIDWLLLQNDGIIILLAVYGIITIFFSFSVVFGNVALLLKGAVETVAEGNLRRALLQVMPFILIFLWCYIPGLLLLVVRYRYRLSLWTKGAKPVQVIEIQKETYSNRTGQHENCYAVVRPLQTDQVEKQPDFRVKLFYEFCEIHSYSSLKVGVDAQINAQKLYLGDLVYLYYSPRGEYGITHHSRKSLTMEFLKNAMIWAFWVSIIVYGQKFRYGSHR